MSRLETQAATALPYQVLHAAHCRSTRPTSNSVLNSAIAAGWAAIAEVTQQGRAVMPARSIVPRAEPAAADTEVAEYFVVAEVERADWKAAAEHAAQGRAY